MATRHGPLRSPEHGPSRTQVCSLALPVIVWAVHFIVIYTGISAACAPRALLSHGSVLVGTMSLTLVALAVALLPVLRPVGDDPALLRAARWTALIAVAAIVFNAVPVALFHSCGG